MSVLAFPSLQTFFDVNGAPLRAATAYFYEANTTTQLAVYNSGSLDVAHAQPVVASSFGRFPVIFTNAAVYKVRIFDALGGLVEEIDDLPGYVPSVIDEGGGDPVDENALLTTGDVIWNLRAGTRAGWVRSNGRTISNALGGGTERANDDTAALFAYLWNNLPQASGVSVSGGRGASAAADYGENKTLALPNLRGRFLGGVEDMGNTALPIFTGGTFDYGTGGSLYGSGGRSAHTLTAAQMPVHAHFLPQSLVYHTVGGSTSQVVATLGGPVQPDEISGTAGGGGAHNILPPFVLGTWYMRL